MNVYILPKFDTPDRGEGGIRRVVEAQKKWLPEYGWNVVNDIQAADLVAYHGGMWEDVPPGMPVISHTHGLYWDEYYKFSKAYTQINQDVIKSLRQADVTTAPSEWVAQTLRRNMWLDPVVLYHGIDIDEWPAPAIPENYVLWNKTRIDPICDPAPVAALARLVPDQQFVSTFVNQRDLPQPNITIIGREPYAQAKERVQNASVYLSTARETFGIGTLEALAAGVPVLGFDWGGNSEIVVHKEHGYLARVGDYDDLAVGLDYIRRHRAYLSHSARAYVAKEFSWKEMIRHYATLYTALLKDARERPKLSVIIPYYNLPRYLIEAVKSVKETCINISHEIIIIDDASPEPVPEGVADIPGVIIYRNPENLHIAGTLDVGLQISRGEYIVNLDADNRLSNIGILINALDRDRSLDIAYGLIRVFPEDKSHGGYVSNWPPREANLTAQLNRINQIHSSAVYRRKIAERVGGYRRRCRRSEDADFWTRCLLAGAKAKRVTDNVTLEYRVRPDSLSRTHPDWNWESWYGWGLSRNRLSYDNGPVRIYDQPKISIIIPVGPGHEKYLSDALDSVQAQNLSFVDWEVVVINDTGRQLHLSYPWVRPFNGFRKGVAHARNLGIAASRSDLVLFLDADDYLHPNALHHLYNAYLAVDDDSVFVYGDWFIAETGERKYADDFDPTSIFGSSLYPVTCLYNKHTLNKHNIRWDESFKDGWEDWDFAIQAVTAGLYGAHVPIPVLHYRTKSGELRLKARENEEAIRLKINDKYHDFITGVREMPGCCGGGRYASAAAVQAAMLRRSDMPTLSSEENTTLVEYNPPAEWTGTRSFLGRVTGIRYRFGTTDELRVVRVHNEDVPGLEALGYFKVQTAKTARTTPLKSEGPPPATTTTTVAPAPAPTTTTSPTATTSTSSTTSTAPKTTTTTTEKPA